MTASGTLLSRQDFIDRVNRWSEQRQAPTLTGRMLEDWNEEGIFPAAISVFNANSRVPAWFYNQGHYFRALLISRLKKQGASRFSELRTILWFRGIDIPGGPPRIDLINEFKRSVNLLLRPINSTYIPTCDENENLKRAASLRKQLGEQAPIFKNTFLEARDDWILAGYKEGRFSEPQNKLRELENSALDGFAAELGLDRQAMPEINWPPGLMAAPDENDNAGILLIEKSSDTELVQARNIFRVFMRLPAFAKFIETLRPGIDLKLTREISGSIPSLKMSMNSMPAWRLILLVNFLSFAKQAPQEAGLVNFPTLSGY